MAAQQDDAEIAPLMVHLDHGFPFERFPIGEEYLCKSRLTCDICLLVLNNPKELPCRHVFCHPCIVNVNRHSNNGFRMAIINQSPLESQCQKCKKTFQYSEIKDVCFKFQQILDDLDIKCDFDGCDKYVKLGELQQHELRCDSNPQRLVNCPDCNDEVRFINLKRNHRCHEGHLRRLTELNAMKNEVFNELDKQRQILKM